MICVACAGIPHYASCAIEAFIRSRSHEEVRVIATVSDVPKTTLDIIEGSAIVWVGDEDRRTLKDLLGKIPKILVVSGWFIPSFLRYVNEVRRNGGKVIALTDNRWTGEWRDWFRVLKYRLIIRRKFNAFMTPGKSGKRLLKNCGVGEELIRECMYTANPRLFFDDRKILLRDKRILFVGRLDARKNVLALLETFIQFTEVDNSWKLTFIGQGCLRSEIERRIKKRSDVEILPFMQPEQLAQYYRRSRVFVLPSQEDHWGVVVHEAALSGCALLLSNNVGAKEDLLGESNGYSFAPKDHDEMVRAFEKFSMWSDEQWAVAEKESCQLASSFSPRKFAINLNSLIEHILL